MKNFQLVTFVQINMKDLHENFQPQFSGFFNTPHLFLESVFGMQPFLKTVKSMPAFNRNMPKNIRLGQRVERFVAEELSQINSITLLSENCQIQTQTKQTIGEIDCLLLDNKQPIHLEIQFKYYLYDETLGETEIDHCIGPMRRDTLKQKLFKLKEKQLPLLYHPETKTLLNSLNLKATDFKQHIYFKAQLFMPYGKTIKLKQLNPDCIYGYYFKYNMLHQFKDYKFYKPKKTDWLLDVTTNVNWKTYEVILPELLIFEAEQYAPLLWIKHENGLIDKCFVTI